MLIGVISFMQTKMTEKEFELIAAALDNANVKPEERIVLLATKEQRLYAKMLQRKRYNKYTKARRRVNAVL